MPSVSIMIKPASSLCNLSCKYCFYRDVASSRDSFSFGIMKESTMQKLVAQALLYSAGGNIYFTFQGGEPLLAGKDFYRKFFDFVSLSDTSGGKISYFIQTNGTLIDDEWAELFRKNKFLVGLSLDGSFEYNKHRIDSNGKSSFYKVLDAIRILERHGVDFNIVSVITSANAADIGKIYDYFKKKKFKYLQFIPCLKPMDSRADSKMHLSSEQYGDFLIKAFKRYAADFERGDYISVRTFDNFVRLYFGDDAEQCGMNGRCERQFVVESNGNVYPCDFYCTDGWLLGNINEMGFAEISQSEKSASFLKIGMTPPQRCIGCEYYQLCRGQGCRRYRESSDFCESYKRFFKECLPLFRKFAK